LEESVSSISFNQSSQEKSWGALADLWGGIQLYLEKRGEVGKKIEWKKGNKFTLFYGGL